MGRELDSAQILRHLDEDMGMVLELFKHEDLFEVMLNPYLREDGLYEGHIWYERAGIGMIRLTNSERIEISGYPMPKVGDKVISRYVEEEGKKRVLNYHVVPENNELLEAVSIVLKNSLLTDREGKSYMEQEEHYKLNILADNIEEGIYHYRQPIAEDELLNVYLLMDKVNYELSQLLGIAFRLEVVEINSAADLAPFGVIPEYVIAKEFVKMSASKAEQIMGILASANSVHFHAKEPILEVSIPYYHHRFSGQREPVVKFPAFSIRKHSSRVITLDEYVEKGILPAHCAETIRDWIRHGYNILVAGGTGSGKTTLLNGLIYELAKIDSQRRAIIIEDTPEVQCALENSVSFTKTNEVNIDKLLVTSLRMRPDSIMVGEIRSREAYTLYKAMLTGHRNCFGTIHANGAYEATFRFEQCIKEHPDCANMPVPREQVSLALNAVISIQKTTVRVQRNGYWENVVKRKVTALREILGYDPKHDIYEDNFFYQDKEAILEKMKPERKSVNKYQSRIKEKPPEKVKPALSKYQAQT